MRPWIFKDFSLGPSCFIVQFDWRSAFYTVTCVHSGKQHVFKCLALNLGLGGVVIHSPQAALTLMKHCNTECNNGNT